MQSIVGKPIAVLPYDLGDGLTLRRATPADADRLAEFNSKIHSDNGPEDPDQRVGVWTRDLLSGQHPTFAPDDFTLVEESGSGRIISSMNLISQVWEYAGIPFKVGRPELVGTHPEFRRRGLVRKQFEVVHQWSRERGEMVQAITGIPNYYRQFGYEMCVDLGGGRVGYKPLVPNLPEGQAEPYIIRPAVAADAPFIAEVYDAGRKRSLLSCVWTEDLWRYEIAGKNPDNVDRMALFVIETPSGEPLGFFGCPPYTWGPNQATILYELKPGVSWWAVTPSVIRSLWKIGEANAIRDHGEMGAYGFWLGQSHPAYQVISDRLPRVRRPYAWFIRVPDLAGFLRHITPVLEGRLAESVCIGFTGNLKLNFYQSGLNLTFTEGRLSSISHWQETRSEPAAAAFPGLTFYQLLFGYRALTELRESFADCRINDEKYVAVLNSLFPYQPSDIKHIS
ncbi:MAG TPA: GNAT family N-acetyltransferase [Anaerolineaceae bacterium]|nr:GNAT family N-acetyltransferase [Anaerolineaceae bacterium]